MFGAPVRIEVNASTLHALLELVDKVLADATEDEVLETAVIRTNLSNVSALRGAAAEVRVHAMAPA